jgi:hypothetical protein
MSGWAECPFGYCRFSLIERLHVTSTIIQFRRSRFKKNKSADGHIKGIKDLFLEHPKDPILGSKMQVAVHRQPLYFHKYKHFIRLTLSQPKVAPVLPSAQAQEQGATF